MRTENALLVARQLAFSYGAGRPAIFSGVDLHIERQEIVCLIGASGCGKSTLLRLLAGLAEATSGEVTIAETPADATTIKPAAGPGSIETTAGPDAVNGKNGAKRAGKASVVFQSPALLPWLSVADNVAFGLDFSGRPQESKLERKTRIENVLAQVDLTEHAQKKPAALSGGMAQRVALARALARQPEIIYLDEPFSALDAITREAMQDLLLDLAHRQKSAALLVTHDIDEALRIGDRVLLLARPHNAAAARIVGEWRPGGKAPRQHRSSALNAMREEILNTLSDPATAWFPTL